MHPVVAGAAVLDVRATADPDAVVAVVAVHDVVAPAAAEDVVALAAVERVGADTAAHAVVSTLAVEGVVAPLAEDEVVSFAGVDGVVTAAGVDPVVPDGAGQVSPLFVPLMTTARWAMAALTIASASSAATREPVSRVFLVTAEYLLGDVDRSLPSGDEGAVELLKGFRAELLGLCKHSPMVPAVYLA